MNVEWIKEQHEERKNSVLSILNKGEAYFLNVAKHHEAQSLASLRNQLENERFSIVVVGEFSAGKSTFLNALMGEKYLPSFTSETTATVNFLRHISELPNSAPQGSGSAIYYKDPNKKTLYSQSDIETIERFVSTKSDLNVVNEIERVELFLDSKFLGDGVVLIDSPGLNGVAEGHKEITEHQIEQSHACIFMFSAEQPGRKTDFEFLAQLKSKVDTIILVINKIDVIKANEQSIEEVMDSLRQNYHQFFPEHTIPEIWPIAAYPALVGRSAKELSYLGREHHSETEKVRYLDSSRIEAFEERLWRFLVQGEKTAQQLKAPADRVNKLLTLRLKEVQELKAGLENSADSDEVSLEIIALEKEVADLEQSIADKKQSFFDEISRIIRETSIRLESRTLEMKQRQSKEIQTWTDLNEVQDDVQQFNNKIIKQYMLTAQKVHDEFVDEFIELLHVQYKDYRHEIEERLNVLPDRSGIFQLETRLDTDAFDFNFGIEEYRTKKENYEEQLEELEKQMVASEENRMTIMEINEARQELQAKLDSVKDREETYRLNLGLRPGVSQTQVEYTEFKNRGGLFGKIADTFKGKQEVTRHKLVTDDFEQKNYDKRVGDMMNKYAEEEKELRTQLNEVQKPGQSEAQVREAVARLQRMYDKKQKEQEKLEREFQKEFQRKNGSALRKVKNQVDDMIDHMEKEVINLLKKELRSQRNLLSDVAVDIIQSNIQQLIRNKKDQLMLRKRQLDSSVNEKEILITGWNIEIATVEELLIDSASVLAELSLIDIDKIFSVNR
ncbi:dynamin family protein [Saccharibacillus brassicae]|uniref:Dynamin N-terminal domain-containing protein n=1 Tax=Saccharibacillus brassicae TaxID=2583377 RepID=A0A4Y6UZJ1_SACBS|nr:dynamin family protein [Saccharibacillus brassicae]QDH22000.1 hypothetical protein FFV09_14810 [Saccharibacillus brassicae]